MKSNVMIGLLLQEFQTCFSEEEENYSRFCQIKENSFLARAQNSMNEYKFLVYFWIQLRNIHVEYWREFKWLFHIHRVLTYRIYLTFKNNDTKIFYLKYRTKTMMPTKKLFELLSYLARKKRQYQNNFICLKTGDFLTRVWLFFTELQSFIKLKWAFLNLTWFKPLEQL